jgi:hypothetical protein
MDAGEVSGIVEVSSASTADVAGWPGRVVVTVTFETILGLLAAFFIGFFAPVLFGIGMLSTLAGGRWEWCIVCAGLALVTGRLAVLIMRLAAHASTGRWGGTGHDAEDLPVVQMPFALAMAAQLPRWPLVLRMLVGFWWLAHFGGAALLAHAIGGALIRRLDVATALIAVPLAVMVHFAFLFAANLYLVLSARMLSPHPKLCVFVWRYRFAIDFVIALALVTLRAMK